MCVERFRLSKMLRSYRVPSTSKLKFVTLRCALFLARKRHAYISQT